ncbi:hypothetical protein EV200_104449 [Pedobacter psychrotolerans]|uniref:Immunity protein 26 of polymorphic toxin system n=1 Tax=Pedobacter psychrotolerans TaxID=1843235 RepID=A0A4R2HDF9_9SPHI|nr:Imm26 family immunity protein [Pedobacter psychrotolerans]TCO25411.1 hypothetical protein EV200_104449 [Pedobacter psychrotolerans]GGE45628.1 hypothetical protein GCM10011413_09750 [Pedobacter psychrotolerans]
MTKKRVLNCGDIFYLQLKNKEKYVIGRVLFDVEHQFYKTDANSNNYFDVFRECQLVEIYDLIFDDLAKIEITKTIIPSAFTYRIDSKANQINWGILDNQTVQYEKIEFPEVIAIVDGVVKLLQGELSIPTKYENTCDFNLRFGAEFPIVIANQAAYIQGQNTIVEGFHSEKSFLKMDLRNFPELRNKVYSDLNIDPKKSYYELSKDMGFDLARFY